MTDTSNRSRVQAGVPTGGEFAHEAKGENPDLTIETTSTRARIEKALESDPKGTHGKTLKMYLASYEAFADLPFFDPSIVDKMAEAEFETQAKVEEALADLGDNPLRGDLIDFQDKLCRAHGVTLQRHVNTNSDDLKDGAIWGQVYFPRTGVALPIPIRPEALDDPDNALPSLALWIDHASCHDSVADLNEWHAKGWHEGPYPDTEEGWADAKRSYEMTGEAAHFLRAATNSDYPMYVFGKRPTK